jgi:ribosomal protein S14
MLIRQNNYTYPQVPFKRGKRTCPVCGRTHQYHCSVTVDGSFALCRFRWSANQAQDGRYMHVLTPNQRKVFTPAPLSAPKREVVKGWADSDRLHAAYSTLLSRLKLTPSHGDELLIRRGLSDTTIANNLYASVPDSIEGNRMARDLAESIGLSGVPGFYRQDGCWRLNTWFKGFYVPYRDEQGRIVGLQIRRDGDAGPKYVWLSSSGLPEGTQATSCVHFVKPDLARDGQVLITEGALKADRISDFLTSSVVALAGVTGCNPETFTAHLLRALPGLRSIVVAFDIDWQEKPEVRRALDRLIKGLKVTRLPVNVRTWEPTLGKGLDDVLFRGERGE